MNLQIHRIETIRDARTVPALRIYSDSFPLEEKMSVAYWLEALLSLPDPAKHLYIATPEESADDVVAMLYAETIRGENDEQVVALWYLCTRADTRGTGVGGLIYDDLVRRVFADGVRALVFEVEKPEVVARSRGELAEALARRRIAFYQRHGASLLDAVAYSMQVDHNAPPVAMHVMVHTPNPVNRDTALRYANIALGGSVTDLTL